MSSDAGGGWTPPPPPGSGSGPWGAPPAPPPYQPGPYPPEAYVPGGYPPGQYPPVPYPPLRKTNPLAVVALVAGLAQFLFCFFGGIVAIVTGHIARGQIKRTGEQGRGMALAGLILGYVGVVLTVFAVVGFIVVAVTVGPNTAQREARSDAREFAAAILRADPTGSGQVRDPNLLLRVYAQQASDRSSGCCGLDTLTLADGTPFLSATRSDWVRAGWRINVRRSLFADRYACITVPGPASGAAPSPVGMVRDGRC